MIFLKKFLEITNKTFAECVNGRCPSKDNSGDTLHITLDTNNNFGYVVKNAQDSTFSGPELKCVLEEHECYSNREDWHLDPSKREIKKWYSASCQAKPSGARTFPYTYEYTEALFIDGGRLDSHFPTLNFPSLSHLMQKHSIYKEIEVPSKRHSWASPITGVGVAGALFCGYKTIKALTKGFSADKPDQTAAEAEKQKAEKVKAKKEAFVYGIATVASTILGGYAFFNATSCPKGATADLGKCYQWTVVR